VKKLVLHFVNKYSGQVFEHFDFDTLLKFLLEIDNVQKEKTT